MRKYSLIFIIMTCVLMAPFTVIANSPAPARSISIRVFEKPNECVFVDLLIKISNKNDNYVTLNSEYIEKLGFDENSEIVQYSKNAYESYTFHFLDAVSDNRLVKIELNNTGTCYDAEFAKYSATDSNFTSTALSRLQSGYSNMKLVLLDADGDIIQISDRFSIGSGRSFSNVLYNADTNKIEIKKYIGPVSRFFSIIVLLLLAALSRFAFSIGIETLIALPFKLKPYRKIIAVNFLTQLFLTFAMGLSSFDYIITVIVLEIFVYLSEFIIYLRLYKKFSKIKILLYTIIANTVSLGIGLLLNQLSFFKG